MINKFKYLEEITGYNLSGCYLEDDLLIVQSLKLIIIEDLDYERYSFGYGNNKTEVIRTTDFYRLLLNSASKDITDFVCDEVLYQIEETGIYLNDDILNRLYEVTSLIPLEEDLSDQFYAEGLDFNCSVVYDSVKKIKDRKKKRDQRVKNYKANNK